MRILVLNGPNINLLGLREPEIYGRQNYAALLAYIHDVCTKLGIDVECVQSNHEGTLVDAVQDAYGRFDGIVINPAAYTHTSVALLDALKSVGIPAVEVHLSNVREREVFRQTSFVAQACEKTVSGKGFEGYAEAIRYLAGKLRPSE